MKKDYLKIKQWLDAVPATDNPFLAGHKNNTTSWNTWIKQGKSIPEIEEVLLEMLKSNQDEIDKGQLLMSIGYVGSERSYFYLIDSAKDDNPLIRMEAIGAIGNLKLQKAVPFLCQAVGDLDQNVRANAYTALGKLKGTKALECIQKGLNDHIEFVKTAAKKAIDSFGNN